MFKLTIIKNDIVEYEEYFWSYYSASYVGMRYQAMGYNYVIKKVGVQKNAEVIYEETREKLEGLRDYQRAC